MADSDRMLEVKGYTYFPREAVRMDLLRKAPKTPSDLRCPHRVQFFDVTDGKVSATRAAWSYEAPRDAMKQVDHWIGFWNEVEVE